jgi:RsiW-degrading membrane proteinase PrsW (M82 family)
MNIASGFGGVQLSSIVFWRTLVAIFGALALLIALASRTRPPHKSVVLWIFGIGAVLLFMALCLNLELFPVPLAY